MDKVRFGIVGLGNMGTHHVNSMGEIENATLAAICDADPARVERLAKGREVAKFNSWQEMISSGKIDAILIATPHPQHCEIARAAFAGNVHVLTEKPLAVTIKEARETLKAHQKHPNLKFGIMFQMRAHPLYAKIRELINDGELGAITRLTWIVTDWFRTHAYYASGGWRATWQGEGGGVLINQCPHNLDLIPWLTGMMPSRVTASVFIGKTHPIEVEDEVSAILEFPNGASGHFITSTGEAPGTNRLEICGDRGKLIAENGKLTFHRTRRSVKEVLEKDPNAFAIIETWPIEISWNSAKIPDHKAITQNFVNAILKNEPLIAPADEGSRGLELGNAMLLAGVTRTPVDLPVDGDKIEQLLKDLQAKYGGRKTLQTRTDVISDMNASFKK